MSAVQVIVPRSSSTTTPKLPATTTALPLRIVALRPRLDSKAATPAEIISRSLPQDGPPVYTLRMGTVKIPDIPLEEIFDYVSEHDLEVFENQSFQRDREAAIARAIAKKEARTKSRELKWLQGNGEAGSGRASSSGSSNASRSPAVHSESSAVDQSGDAAQDGRRPRPSYTHLYKKKREKRGSNAVTNASTSGLPSKRVTVEVQVPIKRKPTSAAEKSLKRRSSSPEGVYAATATAVNIGTPSSSSKNSASSSEDQVQAAKRRRLVGPSPSKPKLLEISTGSSAAVARPECKMPSRSTMDIANPEPKIPSRNTTDTVNLESKISSQRMMDIAKPEPKISSRSMMDAAIGSLRDQTSSSSPSSSTNSETSGLIPTAAKTEPKIPTRSMVDAGKTQSPGQTSSSSSSSIGGRFVVPTATKPKKSARSLMDIEMGSAKGPLPPRQTSSSSSSLSTGGRASGFVVPAPTKSITASKPAIIRSSAAAKAAATEPTRRAPIDISSDSSDNSGDSDSDPALVVIPAASKSAAAKSVAGEAASTDPSKRIAIDISSDSEAADSDSDSDSDSGSESYIIESILNHALSDPRTHAAELGQKPVMLYHVKWAGYDQLTWEPSASFDDTSFIETYWESVEAKKAQKQKQKQKQEQGSGASKRTGSTVSSSSGGKTRGLGVPVAKGGKA